MANENLLILISCFSIESTTSHLSLYIYDIILLMDVLILFIYINAL